jgi:hypothetical protein
MLIIADVEFDGRGVALSHTVHTARSRVDFGSASVQQAANEGLTQAAVAACYQCYGAFDFHTSACSGHLNGYPPLFVIFVVGSSDQARFDLRTPFANFSAHLLNGCVFAPDSSPSARERIEKPRRKTDSRSA